MKRHPCILICQIALGSLHLTAATAAEQIESPADNESTRYVKVLKRCQEVENPILVPGSALYGLDAVGWVRAELGQSWPKKPMVTAKIELAPQHGTILGDYFVSDASRDFPFYVYRPKSHFRGRDRVKISVSINGSRYLVDFSIQVVEVTVDGKCVK